MLSMKVTSLTEQEIQQIGHAFGYYDYGEERGLVSAYSSQEDADTYICGYVRTMLKAGELYTTSEQHEGFTAFHICKYDGTDHKKKLSDYGPLLKGVFASMSLGQMFRTLKVLSSGGKGLHDEYHKQKKPHIYVGMVVVTEAFQHQGFMREVMELSYAEGRRLGIPVILDTDAKSKCDKYVHLGMKVARERKLSDGSVLYDLIWEPGV